MGFPVLADGEDKQQGSTIAALGLWQLPAVTWSSSMCLWMCVLGDAGLGWRQDLIFLQEEDVCAGFA